MTDFKPTRRNTLAGLGLAGAALGASSLLPTAPAAAAPAKSLIKKSAKENMQAYLRMKASLETEKDIYWWYEATLLALVEGEPHRPLCKLEGLEVYYVKDDPNGYRLHGSLVSYFRDFETGAFLDTYDNPFTGEANKVMPNVFGGGPGYLLNEEGLHFAPGMPAVPLDYQWTEVGDMIWYTDTRLGTAAIPSSDAQTITAPMADFKSDKLSINSLYSSTYIASWLPWMNMGDRPGQTVWHAVGRKVESLDDFPDEIRARLLAENAADISAAPK